MRPVQIPKGSTIKNGKLKIPKRYRSVSDAIASKKRKKLKAVQKWSRRQ